MYILDIVTKIAACVGAINWGLIALFEFNLVTALFGGKCYDTSCLFNCGCFWPIPVIQYI